MRRVKTVTLESRTAKELRSHLLKELALFRGISDRFRDKYKMTLSELEEKIKREGVSVEKHEVWEDSIEWRNAVEEIEKLEAILAELSVE